MKAKTIFKVAAGAVLTAGSVIAAPILVPAAATALASTAIGTAIGTAAAGVGSAIAASAVGTAVGGAAAAVGTAATGVVGAVATSAVGTAATGAMAAVGSAVGTAAGAVGVTSVATVAGTSAGAAAVGTIATSGAVAAVGAGTGMVNMAKAEDISEGIEAEYKEARKSFDAEEAKTNHYLEKLGKSKIRVWSKFSTFEKLFNQIQNLEISGNAKIDKKLKLDEYKLQDVRILAMSASEVMKGGTIALSSGQLIGAASSSCFTVGATASTGTAIAELHGAAQYKATMALFGGGSKAVGGLGMAGGAVVTKALAFAPAAAISGILLAGKGISSLKSANDAKLKSDELMRKMAEARNELTRLSSITKKLTAVIDNYGQVFDVLLEWLDTLVSRETDARKYSELELTKCYAVYRIVEILYDLTTTLLYTEETDHVKIQECDVEKVLKDADNGWKEYKGVENRTETPTEDERVKKKDQIDNDTKKKTVITAALQVLKSGVNEFDQTYIKVKDNEVYIKKNDEVIVICSDGGQYKALIEKVRTVINDGYVYLLLNQKVPGQILSIEVNR